MFIRINGKNYIRGGGHVNDQGVTIRAAKRKRRKRRSIRCCIDCKKPTLRWYENKAPREDE